jgi:carboxylesterase
MRLHAESFALGDGPDACLLLHGLTGTPAEVRPVGEALAKSGFRAVGPLLPGHGTSPEDLFTVSRVDLLNAARGALLGLRGARRLFLCGLSMGALLAIELASRSWIREGLPDFAGIALLAPAVKFAGPTWVFTEIVGRLPALLILLPKGKRDIAEVDDREREPSAYDKVPMRWGRELRLLSEEALRVAPRVRPPALILLGAKDGTTSAAGARQLARALGSAKSAQTIVLARSGHVLPLDAESAQVCSDVVGFFQGV